LSKAAAAAAEKALLSPPTLSAEEEETSNYSRERWRFSQFLSDSVLFSSVLCCAVLCAKSALLCKGGWGLELVGNAKRQRESKQQQPLYKQVDGWMDGGR
jgi:hypothetical protein